MRRYCGREFCAQELALIRALIAEDPSGTRADLSRLTCQRLHWYKADGGLKEMSCRVAMLRMQQDALIELPPPRCQRPQARIRFTPSTAPQPALEQPVHALAALQLQAVHRQHDSRLWNEYIHRYHYLGYQPLPGAQLRYFVSAGSTRVALLGFGASAWQSAARERFIGWGHESRKRNLHLIVNNARFLILPWVKCQNLASKLLAMAARQVPDDWQARYGYRPVLMETFVEAARFTGACYRAANWTKVGQTKGRGKLGPSGKQSVPVKDLWLYPLQRNFRRVLSQ